MVQNGYEPPLLFVGALVIHYEFVLLLFSPVEYLRNYFQSLEAGYGNNWNTFDISFLGQNQDGG